MAAFYFGANSVAAAQNPPSPAAGDDLATRVRSTLSGDAFKNVTVSVAGRAAVLSGTVNDQGVRAEVEEAARNVVGIEVVRNQLTVEPSMPGEATEPTETETEPTKPTETDTEPTETEPTETETEPTKTETGPTETQPTETKSGPTETETGPTDTKSTETEPTESDKPTETD